MDSYVTGTAIRQLREAKHMTQAELAEKLAVSAKAISKWETAHGLPDISLLEPLAAALGVSVLELMQGEPVVNRNRSANLLRSKLYVCPLCGNVLHATGQAVVSCCGITLPPLDISEADDADEHHQLTLERVEDELFVTIHHPMTKDHYISFIACLTGDKLQLVKLYPEGDASCRFKITGAGVLYFYCNRHGLMKAPDFRAAARHTPSQKLHLREPDEGDREQVMAYREEFLAISSCPLCGNVLHATGQAVVSCCGITLPPLDISEADDADEHHQLTLERVEDELFVTIHHPMTKDHYISFIACLTGDKLQLVKLYPEGDASCRFKITGAGVLYFYCNRHGLMKAPDFRAAARHTPSQKLHLREPDEGDREQVMAYREEFLAISSRLDGTSALDKYDDFGQWLADIRRLKDPATTPAGFVPATQYLALDEQEHLVGMTNLRHHLNDYLLAYGGHIGYSVRPSERKNGYASQMLRQTLEKAKERGISKVRICCDHYNIASAKTIQACGGILEDEMFDSSDGMLTQRYWIENR